MISYEITETEFDKISKFVYDQVGIHLALHKINLVRGRLSKRLRHFGFNSFTEYYEYLLDDDTGEELLMLTNEISTNVTSFFREPSQWEYLEKELKRVELNDKTKKIRVWSAACSSGQEPYTIAMFLLNNLKSPSSWDIKILATDISEEILLKAASGIYSSEEVKGLPKNMIAKYFDRVKIPHKEGIDFEYKIKSIVKDMITFRKFNLVHSSYTFIKQHTFNWVFCRNVMIYFDATTKNKVVLNLVDKVKKDGHFFIGHSESLVTMNKSDIKMQAPSIYKKI
ncbi:MAG: protein-glutamate O-methyltransferase CheR [Arcobacteraceae bacterium]|nr:protein-glutamate O-methyltransferase CheR [Arcobacteraceae bacterium]